MDILSFTSLYAHIILFQTHRTQRKNAERDKMFMGGWQGYGETKWSSEGSGHSELGNLRCRTGGHASPRAYANIINIIEACVIASNVSMPVRVQVERGQQ